MWDLKSSVCPLDENSMKPSHIWMACGKSLEVIDDNHEPWGGNNSEKTKQTHTRKHQNRNPHVVRVDVILEKMY